MIRWRHLSSKEGAVPVPGPTQQTLCLVLDVDKDGVDDFVIGCRQSAPAMTWFRRGPEGWTKYLIDDTFLTIEAGGAFYDIDGDGDLDIVAGGDWQSNKLYWWENPHPHHDPKVPWKRREIKNSGGNQHHDQIFGDFDGDGRAELVFWNQSARKLYWAPIPQDPRSTEPWPYREIFSGAGEGLALGDLDGDGKVELLAGGRWFKYRGGARGGSTPTFDSYVIDEAQSHPRIAVGDLDGDGRLEVVMVPGDGVGRLKWYACSGDPKRREAWQGHDLVGADVVHGHSLAVADFDHDGNLDIFCAEMSKWTESAPTPNHPDAKMWLLFGDGKGGFRKTEIASGYGVHEAKIGNLDGDGDLDILCKPYCWETPRIDLWLNDGLMEPGRG